MSINEIESETISSQKNINNTQINGAIPFITYNESTKKFIISK